jgi:hypothetical protein
MVWIKFCRLKPKRKRKKENNENKNTMATSLDQWFVTKCKETIIILY